MKIDILVVVSTTDSATVLSPLLHAASRASCAVGVFFTNDGVSVAADTQLTELLSDCCKAVVCADSWARVMQIAQCPIELGSQTDHSQMAAEAGKIISL